MTSTDLEYFNDIYRDCSDPWNFETSGYESRKYALTMSSLPRERYLSAFEPGCSIGVLSELLACRCDYLLSTDIVQVALDQTAARVAHCQNVTVQRLAIPEEWPDDEFDLIVVSELGYYFDDDGLGRILSLISESTQVGAHVVGVHWRGETDYPLRADEVHRTFTQCPSLKRIVHHEEEMFLLDVWERVA